MNGKKARAIRRAIYGDFSIRKRDYTQEEFLVRVNHVVPTLTSINYERHVTVRNEPNSRRARYQRAKKAYMSG